MRNMISLKHLGNKVFGRYCITSQFSEKNVCHISNQKAFLSISRALSSAKDPFPRDKPGLIIGAIGQRSHGKTHLACAMSKVVGKKYPAKLKPLEDFDKSPEEKKKGHTINTMLVEMVTNKRHYAFSDAPGHLNYFKNLLPIISRADALILVVSAVEGVTADTKVQLLMAKHLGVQHFVAYINKVDQSDAETTELVELEIRGLFDEMGLKGDDLTVVSGSALCAIKDTNKNIGEDSIIKLLDAMDSSLPQPPRDQNSPFLYHIEKFFPVPGGLTVASGHVEKGSLKERSDVEILGFGKTLKSSIVKIETFQQTLESAIAGDKCEIQLKGVKRDDLKRGFVVAKPKTKKLHEKCVAEIGSFPGFEDSFKKLRKVNMFSRAWNSVVSLTPVDQETSKNRTITAHCEFPLAMFIEKDQKFILADNGHPIGYGIVTSIK